MKSMKPMLAVIETHPVQYHAPVYRALQSQFHIPVTAVYGSDFSVAGYRDPEFGTNFAWDTDLLSGYSSIFLSRIATGGGKVAAEVSDWGLAKTLHELAPAAVLLVGYGRRFDQKAFWHAWQGGYSVLFRAETTDHTWTRGPLKGWLRDRFLRSFYRRCLALLYIGQRSFEHYRRLECPESKLVFSPYCVDISPFQPGEDDRGRLRGATRGDLGLSDEHLVVLFSGKLVPIKMPELLLQAVKRLRLEQRARLVVLFVGDGSLRESLERLAQTPPVVAVRFAGFQNQKMLSRYYHASDMLVLPSRSETWGLVINEALHHGLPCVVSDKVGCAPDLVEAGVTGQIFEAGSDQSLAVALVRAMDLVGRPEVREQCRKKVGGYTAEKAAEGIARAYWAVAGQVNRVARYS